MLQTFHTFKFEKKNSNRLHSFIVSTTASKFYVILYNHCFITNLFNVFQTTSSTKKENAEKFIPSGGILAKALRKLPLTKPKSQPSRGCFHPGASVLSRETIPLQGAPPITGVQMVQAMLRYIWPKDDQKIRDRVKLALSLLIGAKVLNVTVPFIFKYSVDYLNAGSTLNMETAPETVLTVATSLLLGCK